MQWCGAKLEPKLLAGAGVCSFGSASASGSDLRSVLNPKVGIRNLSPHLRNSAILRTTKSILELRTKKKLRNCDCGPSKFDLHNSATLHSLRPVLILSCHFSSAQDGFKKQPKLFLESFISIETKNLP
jgi:hypothetical protein